MPIDEEYYQSEIDKAQEFYDLMQILTQTYWKREDLKEIDDDEIDC